MAPQLFRALRLDGFLSFAPGSPAIELRPLNVLIGPNGSGKSNFIEALELLRDLPRSLQNHLREGGTAEDWVWKGRPRCTKATVAADLERQPNEWEEYRIALGLNGQRLDVAEEFFGRSPASDRSDPGPAFVDIEGSRAKIATKFIGPDGPSSTYEVHAVDRQFIKGDESILSQRREQLAYPDLADLSRRFESIYSFRDWSFGRQAVQRVPQSTTLPNDVLLADGSNLALFLNDMEHVDKGARDAIDDCARRFLPRFERMSTRVVGGSTQLYFHEVGSLAPIPAQRLSDGTLRFVAILAALLSPTTPSLICLEEPELGLHPDAMAILADVLRDASTRMQVVVTTHSEALLSRLSDSAESVLVCEHVGGGTVMERLETDRLTSWLEEYSLGEIWRSGKLGGNP